MRRVWKALRMQEILGKLAFVLVGGVFAIDILNTETIALFAKILAYSLINGLAIFCYNAWTGYETDAINTRLYDIRYFTKKQLGVITFLLAILSLFIIFIHNMYIACTALGVLLCWGLYTTPGIYLKGVPFAGIFISFFTEILLFHLSYLFFKPYSFISILQAGYFGLLVAAGHTLHELLDYEADKKAGIYTTAVYWGVKKSKKLVLVLFIISLIYLFFITIFYKTSIVWLSLATLSHAIIIYSHIYRWKSIEHFRSLYLRVFAFALFLYLIIKITSNG